MRHIVVCGLSGSTIFYQHYLINSVIYRKGLLNIKFVLIFSTTFVCNILVLRIQQDIIINHVKNSSYTCHIVIKVEFSRQIFEKCSNVKLYENP
jgi:hypothetical protein